jgi:hypothetical protein
MGGGERTWAYAFHAATSSRQGSAIDSGLPNVASRSRYTWDGLAKQPSDECRQEQALPTGTAKQGIVLERIALETYTAWAAT